MQYMVRKNSTYQKYFNKLLIKSKTRLVIISYKK